MKSLLAAFALSLTASAFAHPYIPVAYFEGKVAETTLPESTTCAMTTKLLKDGSVELKVKAFDNMSYRMIVPQKTISLTLNTNTEAAPYFPMTVHATIRDGKPVRFTAEVDVYGEIEKLTCVF